VEKCVDIVVENLVDNFGDKYRPVPLSVCLNSGLSRHRLSFEPSRRTATVANVSRETASRIYLLSLTLPEPGAGRRQLSEFGLLLAGLCC